MRWWGWWKSEPDQAERVSVGTDSERRRASVTAELDAVLEQVKADQDVATQNVKVASRRATNASRKVIGRTGQWKAVPIPPPPKPVSS